LRHQKEGNMTIIQLTPEELSNTVKQAVKEALSNQPLRQEVDELLTRKDTAKYLDVTMPTINAWEKAGRIKGIRFGHRVFFKKSELLNQE
jgi:excisionase family DNA binding protein